MNAEPFTIENYFLEDYPRTLFPLTTTSVLVEKFSDKLKNFLYNKLLMVLSKQDLQFSSVAIRQSEVIVFGGQ